MSKKRILTIVEGEKADLKLMNHLFKIFFGEGQYFVWAYKTNIYALYNKLEMNDKDEFDSLDIKEVLISMESDDSLKQKLREKYTDIILVFDYDPQDPRFSYQKVEKLKKFFNDSTDNGKLYINYPMVEAFKHCKCKIDLDYENLMVEYKDLHEKKYKSIVNDCTYETDYEKYSRDMCLSILKQNLQKVVKILEGEYILPDSAEKYNELDFEEVLCKQNKLLNEERRFYVLCTCIFFFLDYEPNAYLERIMNLK